MALINVEDVVPIGRETIIDELKSMVEILTKWKGRVEGINESEPMEPDELQIRLRALAGELMLVSGKAESLAKVLTLT